MHPEFIPEKLKELHQQQQKEEPKSSWWQSAWSSIKSKFSKLKNYVIGEHMTSVPCIHVYFDYYFKLLTAKEIHTNLNLFIVADIIVLTYQSLYKPYFSYDGNSRVVAIDTIKVVSTSF